MTVFAQHRRDLWLVVGVGGHVALWGAALVVLGRGDAVAILCVALILGIALNWTSNTVSHIHLHTPLFHATWANGLFAGVLTVLTGIPQSFWKLRHLRHHELLDVSRQTGRLRRLAVVELLAVVVSWGAVIWLRGARAFFAIELPVLLLGLGLCFVQGWQEHAAHAAGVDVRASWYNRFWFNDGYHAAHHRVPTVHWTALPSYGRADDRQSPWPPALRWLESLARGRADKTADLLDALERRSLRAPRLLRAVVTRHRQSWEALLDAETRRGIRTVRIVGGGLFPRTALILKDLLPMATLELVDLDTRHLAQAREILEGAVSPAERARFRFVLGPLASPAPRPPVDLLVVPLAFRGARQDLYAAPPARYVAIHDWMWRRRGQRGSAVVAWWLLKRINVVSSAASEPRPQCVQAVPSQTQPVSAGA
jgi:fatty acid desaturase